MTMTKSKKLEPETSNYENALKELEGIVAKMESGQLPLEEAIQAYERGSALMLHCHQLLTTAEEQVRILSDSNKLNTYNADE